MGERLAGDSPIHPRTPSVSTVYLARCRYFVRPNEWVVPPAECRMALVRSSISGNKGDTEVSTALGSQPDIPIRRAGVVIVDAREPLRLRNIGVLTSAPRYSSCCSYIRGKKAREARGMPVVFSVATEGSRFVERLESDGV